MAKIFVATSAPEGWVLGTWRATSPDDESWEETKPDGTAYRFKALEGASTPGSSTVRLQMVDTTTEVMLLETSAQIFVDGHFFGEYCGHWEMGSSLAEEVQRDVQREVQRDVQREVQREVPEPAAPEVPEVPERDACALEMEAGEEAVPLKSLPAREVGEDDGAMAQGQKAPPPTAPDANLGAAPEEASAWRPQKAAGLDKSAEQAALLVAAARQGDAGAVQELLGTVDPDATSEDGWTALLAASEAGSMEVVQILLDAGADANILKDGNTAMQLAFKSGNQDVFKLLFTLAFQTLDSAVGHSRPVSPTSAAKVQDDEVPETALNDLRDVTKRLAGVGKLKEADVGFLEHAPIAVPAEEPEKAREDALKEAMKQIARA